MLLLKLFLELHSLVKSLFYILTFPFSLLIFVIKYLQKKIWVSFISIGLVQRLWSPRFGTNWFSRLGRLIIINSNVHMFLGGSIAGVAVLFFLYQPMLQRFDGQYYVVVTQKGIAFAAEELPVVLEASPTSIATSSAEVRTAVMPIITELAPTPTPTPRPITPFRDLSRVGVAQKLPVGFVPPAISSNGAYLNPIKIPLKQISTFYSSWHPGMDLVTDSGVPIYSVADGYVSSAGGSLWGYGNVVYIQHANGVQTLYAHLSKIHVTTGQQVTTGTVIGLVGSTGRSSGPHLHFEIHKNDVPFNPKSVIQGL
ncbi:MAG: M23 family metallopeptidase [bacterium]|nr:M23 family metallopeptidase [bacterium]